MKFISALVAHALFLTSIVVAAHSGPGSPVGTTRLTFANGAIHAHAIWTQGPRSPDESLLRLEWKNGSDQLPTEPPGRFKVVLWMPDMGHGSSPTQIEPVPGDSGRPLVGVYQVSDIFFVMGGKWNVRVTLKYANGTEETQTIKVEVESEKHSKLIFSDGSTASGCRYLEAYLGSGWRVQERSQFENVVGEGSKRVKSGLDAGTIRFDMSDPVLTRQTVDGREMLLDAMMFESAPYAENSVL